MTTRAIIGSIVGVVLLVIAGLIAIGASSPTVPILSPTPTPVTTSIQSPSPSSVSATASPTIAAACDQSLWNHIYNPSRLHIIENCKTVTGTIEVVRHEKDGDDHILLKLDPAYTDLLNSKNISDQHGDLILEPVCERAATQADAVAVCQKYRSDVKIPPLGSHVEVVGSYVLDAEHGWNEIHPVTSISVIGKNVPLIPVVPSSKLTPTPTQVTAPIPQGASAQCNDGTYSYSQHHQGTCSHHGGVAEWL